MYRTTLILVLLSSFIAASEPVFDKCMVNAYKMISDGRGEMAMNEIRIGINVYWYEEKHLNNEIEKTYQDSYKLENDKSKRSNLAIGISSFYFIKKDIAECRKWLSAALENDPQKPEVFNMRGATYLWENNSDEAIKAFTKAIELKPNYLDALYNRCNLYMKSGQIENGIKDRELYQRIIQTNGLL